VETEEEAQALKKSLNKQNIPIPFTSRSIGVQSLLYNIPLADLLVRDKKAANDIITSRLKSMGKSDKEIKTYLKLVEQERLQRSRQEATEAVASEAISELIGGFAFANRFKVLSGTKLTKKGSFWRMFKEGAAITAPLGFFEGAQSELSRQRIRGEKLNIKEAAILGGYGTLTAGLFGGLTTGFFASSTKKAVTTGIGYMIDPYELIGDVTASALTKSFEKVTGKKLAKAQFTFNIPLSKTITVGTKTKTKTKTKTITKELSKFNPLNVTIGTTTDIGIFSNIPTETETKTGAYTGAYVGLPTQAQTNIPSSVPTNINIGVPVNTPLFRMPPPIIPPLSFGTGTGTGTKKGKGKAYISELQLGLGLLNISQKNNKIKPTKRKKRK